MPWRGSSTNRKTRSWNRASIVDVRELFGLARGPEPAVGYHRASFLEWKGQNGPVESAGTHVAGLVTFYPEIGYLITDHIGIAVQGRLEYFPTEGSGDTQAGRPANGAIAVLGRGLYYLDLGSGNAQIQFSVDLGGGDYRYNYPPTNHARQITRSTSNGCERARTTDPCTLKPTLLTDSIRSGPFLYGAGAGFIYHFTHWFAANLELRFLGAGPHFGLLGEGYASAQFSLGGKRPAQPGDAPPMERLPEEDEPE